MVDIKSRKRVGLQTTLVLLCSILFFLLFAPAASASLLGDVNNDGLIDVRDVVLVEKHVLSVPPGLNPAEQALADVNGDGLVNVTDVSLIMQYTLGLINEFPVGDLKVMSVKALNAKTIGVEFNKVPSTSEKSAITVTVKSAGSIVIPTTVTWDGKVAHVKRTIDLNYTTGTYTVEVAGITPAFSGTVAITVPTATTLEIEAAGIPNDTAKAPLRVVLLDQYGEEMSLSVGAFNYTAYNLTLGTNVTPKIGYDSTTKFYIDTQIPVWPATPSFYIGNQVQLTFIHIATGLNKTVTIPVTMPTQLNSITMGDPILPAGATVIFKDFTNIRIPITAKDQNGDELFLVKGSNVSVFSSNTSVIANTDLDFITGTDGKQYLNITKFLNDGNVIVTILGTPGGVVANKTLSIVKPVPSEIRVSLIPEKNLLVSESTTVKFDIYDQFGNKITVNVPGYGVRAIKSSGANAILSAPVHNNLFTIVEATTGINVQAAAGAMPGDADTVTFRLEQGGIYLDSEAITFNVISDLTALSVLINKSSYTAGENMQLTLTATIGGFTHTAYNKSGPAVIRVCDNTGTPVVPAKFYNRTLSFTNGVATTTVPASLAGANYRLGVDYNSLVPLPLSELFTVAVGAPSKFKLAQTANPVELDVWQTDSQDNVITTFTGNKILKITYPATVTPPAGVDSEGNIVVSFNAAGIGTITFGSNLTSGTYTVQHSGLTGTIVVP